MEVGLMNFAIDKIEKLKFLFDVELPNIERKAKKGMKEYEFSYMLDFYIFTMASKDDELLNSSSFKSIEKVISQYVDFVNIEQSNENKGIQIRLKNIDVKEHKVDFINGTKNYNKYAEMSRSFCDETIIMLLVKFENVVSEIFKLLFEKYPNKYLNNKAITYAEILSLADNDVKKYIVNELVENTMRESLDDWMKILKSHGMDFDKYEIFDGFREIYYRRNIIVHNSSRVNNQYVEGLKHTKISVGNIKKGSILISDKKYVENAFNTVECFIFAIFIECKRFVDKEDLAEYFNSIFLCAFKLMEQGNYVTSEFVFKFLENENTVESVRMMSKVNRWISQKELYGLNKISKEINDTDFSAKDQQYILAKYILLDEYDKAFEILEDLFPNKISAHAIKEWPLFSNFRKLTKYKEFVDNHKEAFEIEVLES